jgi:GNAT superfamily N-acetyltransferase
MDDGEFETRIATPRDREALHAMQALSMRVLGAADYAPEAIDGLIEQVGTMDDGPIEDGTYLVATRGGTIVAGGGWSTQAPGYGRRIAVGAGEVPPSARVRSVYVHPGWARRGLARGLMARLEAEIAAAGFDRATLAATLTGAPFYRRLGYAGEVRLAIELDGGLSFPVVSMEKPLPARIVLEDAA